MPAKGPIQAVNIKDERNIEIIFIAQKTVRGPLPTVKVEKTVVIDLRSFYIIYYERKSSMPLIRYTLFIALIALCIHSGCCSL